MADLAADTDDRLLRLESLGEKRASRRSMVSWGVAGVLILAAVVLVLVLAGKTPIHPNHGIAAISAPLPPSSGGQEQAGAGLLSPPGAATMAPPTVASAPAAPAPSASASPAVPQQTASALTAPAPPGGVPAAPPVPAADSQPAPRPTWDLPPVGEVKPLPAPDPALQQNSDFGTLPAVVNGRLPRQIFAAPSGADPAKPRIAVVITGLGLGADATTTAVTRLPQAIDLSFSAYSPRTPEWLTTARNNGHEILLDLPLEPPGFPNNDPGPLGVLAKNTGSQMTDKVDAILGKAYGAIGVVASPRSPVVASEGWPSLLKELSTRGLLFVGDKLTPGQDVPAALPVTTIADETGFAAAIDARLGNAATSATQSGTALIRMSATPVGFQRLIAFLATLPKAGITLVPVSALVPGAAVTAVVPDAAEKK